MGPAVQRLSRGDGVDLVDCTELRGWKNQCDQRGVGQEARQAGWRGWRAGEQWDRHPDFTRRDGRGHGCWVVTSESTRDLILPH